MNDNTRNLRRRFGWLALARLVAGLSQAAAHAQVPPGAVYGPPLPPPAQSVAPAGPSQIFPIIGAAKGVAAKLREMYANRPDVKIMDASGSVVVYASPDVQQEVGRWLAAEGLTAP